MGRSNREVAVTACIVGWAHTQFGRLEGETRRKPDRPGGRRRIGRCRHRSGRCRRDPARPFQRRLLGAGFHRLAGAAGLAGASLQACDAGRECLCDRLCCRASGAQGDRRQVSPHRAGGRRRADDHDARGPRSAATCSRPPMCARRPTSKAASPAFSARSPGSISSATATSPTRSPASPPRTTGTASAIPMPRSRKDLGYEFCRTESEKNPFVAGPLKRTDCSLVSDGAAALVLADVEHRATAAQGGRLPRRRACAGLPADVEARHAEVRRLQRGLAARAGERRNCGFTTCLSSRRTTASPSPN